MGRRSCWLAPPILVLSAVAILAADARPQPSADELIDAIVAQGSKIESARSIYLRFEEKLTSSPELVAHNLAELKKRSPDVPIDIKQHSGPWPERTAELALGGGEGAQSGMFGTLMSLLVADKLGIPITARGPASLPAGAEQMPGA